jgi:hypothetical protein
MSRIVKRGEANMVCSSPLARVLDCLGVGWQDFSDDSHFVASSLLDLDCSRKTDDT